MMTKMKFSGGDQMTEQERRKSSVHQRRKRDARKTESRNESNPCARVAVETQRRKTNNFGKTQILTAVVTTNTRAGDNQKIETLER
jgi:hypothetical protein